MLVKFAVGLLTACSCAFLIAGEPVAQMTGMPAATGVNAMDTFEKQKDFFFEQWPKMEEALKEGGAEAAIAFINNNFSEDVELRVMFSFARMGIVWEEALGADTLDSYIPVAEAGMAECLAQAEAAEDEETRNKRINSANVISYNLGADLAYCWDDNFNRSEATFKRGLQAGEDCLRWREELGNPPHTFSMAHWLIGIHKLALDDKAGALENFKEALRYSEISNKENDKPTGLDGEDGSIVLGHGWIALTKVLMGDESAKADYDKAMAIFREQLNSDDEHVAGDAKWYVMQLEKIEKMPR